MPPAHVVLRIAGAAPPSYTTPGSAGVDQAAPGSTRDELRARLDELEAAGASGVIFGTSGVDVAREVRAFAEVAGL